MRSRQNTAPGKRQILAEISFLRLVASTMATSSDNDNDNNDSNDNNSNGVRHIVAVVEMLTDSAIPMILMKKEPRTLRCMQEEADNMIPAQIGK